MSIDKRPCDLCWAPPDGWDDPDAANWIYGDHPELNDPPGGYSDRHPDCLAAVALYEAEVRSDPDQRSV